MTSWDWVVFALYFTGILYLGAHLHRRTSGIEGFFLADRGLPGWAIGLSVMATQASAITFIGTTGQAHDHGMGFIQVYLSQPLVMVVLCVFFVPFFYRSRVFTAYEFLEKRFDAKTRSLTSFLFLISRGIAAGIVLYAPAVVLSVILGWDERATILVMGLITVLYTVAGGIAAVIWTDVLQMLMMFAGIGAVLVTLFAELPAGVGLPEVIYIGGLNQMWNSIDLCWDLSNTYTLWSGLLGGFFLALAYFGCDQSQVQRYLTATSLEQSRLALIFNAFLKVPMQFFVLAIGVLLFVFYHFEPSPLIFNPAEAQAVEQSVHQQRFSLLQNRFQEAQQGRREATLQLLEARASGRDVEAWRRQISHHEKELTALRTESKLLVQEVQGHASTDVNYIFPSYLVQYLPAGILGLVLAVLFAAAMSSLDSELTALSSSTIVDFYRRYWMRKASQRHYLRISRLATLMWGLFAVLVALYAGRLGSLIEAVNRVGSYFYGSLLGVFLLAFLVRKSSGNGAFVGLIIGMLSVFLVSLLTDISWLYYNIVGALTVLFVGIVYDWFRTFRSRLLALLLLAVLILPTSLYGQMELPADRGVSGYGLALRKLPTIGSLLYITAHPDDENNAVLAKVSRGMGMRTALLSLTRGDGGQNEIGPELFEALGILRMEELMAVHQLDGAQQFFTRAFDFGYSFSVEETFEKWGRREILDDMVRVIRRFRPTVVLALNPEGAGGGQHHQASARLAREAVRLAALASHYPDHLREGLRPWKSPRLYHALAPGLMSRTAKSSARAGPGVRIELGVFDPLLGETYAELGARARSLHRCQGMHVLPDPGPATTYFQDGGAVPEGDNFFTGLDMSLAAIAHYAPELASGLELLRLRAERAQSEFDCSNYSYSVRAVLKGLQIVRELQLSTSEPEAQFLLREKEKDFLQAAQKGHFIHFEALATDLADPGVIPGQPFQVAVRFLNRSKLELPPPEISLLLPPGWTAVRQKEEGSSTFFQVKPAASAEYTQAHWYREDPEDSRFKVRNGFAGTEPWGPSLLRAQVRFASNHTPVSLETPVHFQWFDASSGKGRRTEIRVIPELSVRLEPPIAALNLSNPKPVLLRVVVRNNSPGPNQAAVELETPPGWSVLPQAASLDFRYENQSMTVTFRAQSPAKLASGSYRLSAVARTVHRSYRQGYHTIDYPHIQTRNFYRPATTLVRTLEVQLPPGLRVGYVRGVGDKVDVASVQLGAQLVYLEEEDLASADLDSFDAIVTGVRAYLNRDDLRAHNQRLLEYVRRGGHLVVQYNKYEFLRERYAPYPMRMGRPADRVTDESSAVRILEPEHPLFHWPNALAPGDWTDWVQERGLYFWGEWDDRYRPLLELRDPFEYNREPQRGALLIAEFGEGTYVYTGLSFFRQLPAGVPGAYRLWANLLSLGRRSRDCESPRPGSKSSQATDRCPVEAGFRNARFQHRIQRCFRSGSSACPTSENLRCLTP